MMRLVSAAMALAALLAFAPQLAASPRPQEPPPETAPQEQNPPETAPEQTPVETQEQSTQSDTEAEKQNSQETPPEQAPVEMQEQSTPPEKEAKEQTQSEQPPVETQEESTEPMPAEAENRPTPLDEGAEEPADAAEPPDPSADEASLEEALAALPPAVDYDIRVTLKPKTKKLHGFLTLRYTNHAPDMIPDLQFHLYPNAFKNMDSTYMRELGRRPRVEDPWSYLYIRSLKVDGEDRTNDFVYVQTPNGYPGDQTVIQVPLRQPLAPGQTTAIDFEFETKLAQAWDRSGYGDDFFFVAQWFPKLGVWESRGQRGAERPGWNCHSFHANTEFYADFGRYRVRIETPNDYLVGATGVKVSEEDNGDEIWRTFEQDRVHDFAFVAAKDIIRETRMFDPDEAISEEEMQEVMVRHGVSWEEARPQPVEMILFVQPAHRAQADRYFEAMRTAIKHFGLWYGPYPYQTITMVDPPRDAYAVGGMEYPTLVTLGTRVYNPQDLLSLEDVTVHEFAHQYFYGMVASHEVEEAFLDEGFATYATAKVLDLQYGPKPQFMRMFGLRWPWTRWLGLENVTQVEENRLSAYADDGLDAIATPGYAYRHRGGYAINSYPKAATAMAQLERELGEETMARAMRTYVQRWQFKHPHFRDFIDVVNEVAERDMSWFFREVFFEPGMLDYRVGRVFSQTIDSAVGYTDGPDGPVLRKRGQDEEQGDKTQVHYVEILRDGDIAYPVEALVVFKDGRESMVRWNGAGYWKRFRFEDAAKPVKVVIDPKGKLLLDRNRANNSYLAEPDPRASQRWFSRFLAATQHVLQTLAGGF